jgi:hypothetical protein
VLARQYRENRVSHDTLALQQEDLSHAISRIFFERFGTKGTSGNDGFIP